MDQIPAARPLAPSVTAPPAGRPHAHRGPPEALAPSGRSRARSAGPRRRGGRPPRDRSVGGVPAYGVATSTVKSPLWRWRQSGTGAHQRRRPPTAERRNSSQVTAGLVGRLRGRQIENVAPEGDERSAAATHLGRNACADSQPPRCHRETASAVPEPMDVSWPGGFLCGLGRRGPTGRTVPRAIRPAAGCSSAHATGPHSTRSWTNLHSWREPERANVPSTCREDTICPGVVPAMARNSRLRCA
ncbi:hypothetical protein QF027_001112 [Streptomyces canus]|nr:hypothetical protein [Streptomyces canus]